MLFPNNLTSFLLYKGTTGSPKGATLSHNNIVNNSYNVGLRVGYHLQVYQSNGLLEWNGLLTYVFYFFLTFLIRNIKFVSLFHCITVLDAALPYWLLLHLEQRVYFQVRYLVLEKQLKQFITKGVKASIQ